MSRSNILNDFTRIVHLKRTDKFTIEYIDTGNIEYKNKWLSDNKERIGLIVNKGQKDKIKSCAESLGMSLNAYIVALIEKDMEEPRQE